ncbi:MAG: algI [Chthoniobacter sp.]|nr:algI [Chthoniobacter sp.]
MLFHSFDFAVFLAAAVPVFFLLPQVLRPAWLTLISYFFYMYVHPEFGWLLLGCTVIAYAAGLGLERLRRPLHRRLLLGGATALILGVLGYYKYTDFVLASVNHLSGADWPLLNVVLPVGISFFTFQALSYCIDVYRGHFTAERRFDVFAAYKAFFPQLVAGPIERPANVIPQLKVRKHFDWDRLFSASQLILWGFFKKLVIADRLAVFVQEVYSAPHAHSSLQLLLASYAFAFQIFCDFSAYTDIARGTARIFGIELMENFRAPYHARSVAEFWTRWHISLSTWFRDYLYIPLGGNRGSWLRWQINLAVVFLVSGLWHGANWKFAIWGILHAVYLVSGNAMKRLRGGSSHRANPKVAVKAAQILVTFHLVVLAWIFFRAESLQDAWLIIGKVLSNPLSGPALTPMFGLHELLIAVGAILLLESVQMLHGRFGIRNLLSRCPLLPRWVAYYALILGVVVFAKRGQHEFIYFQF